MRLYATMKVSPPMLNDTKVSRFTIRYAFFLRSKTGRRLRDRGSYGRSPPTRCFLTPRRQVISRIEPSTLRKYAEKIRPCVSFCKKSFARCCAICQTLRFVGFVRSLIGIFLVEFEGTKRRGVPTDIVYHASREGGELFPSSRQRWRERSSRAARWSGSRDVAAGRDRKASRPFRQPRPPRWSWSGDPRRRADGR